MLGYISSTRKKSCHSCVKSKRRCDLGYPCCRRCLSKGINCTYPNASVNEAKVMIRHTTPDLIPVADNIVGGATDILQSTSSIDPAILLSDSSSSPDSFQGELCRSTTYAEPRICEALLPQAWEPIILEEGQIRFIVNKLCSFIPSMAFSGNTPFMHAALYQEYQPPAYQDSCSLSALYLMKTDKNVPILSNSINSKISTLLASSNTWTLSEHLAAVQALIIYQIIRLFDPDLHLQAPAEKHNHLLELWTAHLWKRAFNEPNAYPTCYQSWIFYESLRRTVLISVFLRGAWSAVTKNGQCDQVPILARLPLSKDQRLWDADVVEWTDRLPCSNQCLHAYEDLSSSWKPGGPVSQLSEFERLLLAACRGREDPGLLVD
ncbi:hypothetical protein K505DRAFT_256858 [Melanomma pulvis-pyrius CBS 109.77]|uniref:Zn(2)-C6 fungal-type domain-containing protein n=1 Tax=Melanomma pulvis-pyrius CBS 109.77 TaxID=1314802 RepID=A0A6A6WV89_9PLEO|nr:hypothetical protein K505DRAFT_256858 [Melanomma pulvis-pyrius CBS 109.77]